MLKFNDKTGEFEKVEDDDLSTASSQIGSFVIPSVTKQERKTSLIVKYAIILIACFVASWLCVVCTCLIIRINITIFGRLIVSFMMAISIVVYMKQRNKFINSFFCGDKCSKY